MDKRPLILRTLITIVVVAVFASAIHPLFERDYYVTFLGLLVKPASPEEARKVQEEADALVGGRRKTACRGPEPLSVAGAAEGGRRQGRRPDQNGQGQ